MSTLKIPAPRSCREGRRVTSVGWANVARVAARKLVRINDQWRVVFR